MKTQADAIPELYELVTERPPQFVAYRVSNFDDDPRIDINFEARRIATLPGIRKASVEFDWSGTSILAVETERGETIRFPGDVWLVLRADTHPMDVATCTMRDLTGRIMAYSPAEFAERYNLPDM